MPAIPLNLKVFSAFLGEQENIHSVNLPDLYSSGGVSNMWVDKYGRATKIDGYSKQNVSAVVTHTGSAATMVRGYFPYRNTSSGAIARQTLGVFDDNNAHVDVNYSTDNGINWTWLQDLGATANGQIPIFAQFGQICYIVNGKMAPLQWDGTTLKTAGKTQSPTISAATGAAGLLSGTYTYKLVSINSDGTRQYAGAASTVLTVQNAQISLTWSADADVTKKGYEIYRTTGSGMLMYLVAYVNNRLTVAYTDNIADFTILQNVSLPLYGDPPPTTYFCVPHKQRMWWLRTDANPTRGYYSDPGLADSVYQTSSYFDFSDTSDTVGDNITGAVGNFEGLMLVFTEHAVWSISGTGQIIANVIDWRKTRTNAQTGSVSMRSAVRVPAGASYTDQTGNVAALSAASVAYFTPLGDIRLCDGDNDRIISNPVKDSLTKSFPLNYQYRAKVYAVHDTFRNEISWVYPAGVNSECSHAVTWNYKWGVWCDRTWPLSHAIECDTASASSILLGGEAQTANGGYTYLLWNGNSFNGANINAQWMTKTIYGVNMHFGDGVQPYGQELISHQKRWRWLDLLLTTNQNNTLTVEWLPGNTFDTAASYGSATVSPLAATLLTSQGSTILTSQGSSILVASASVMQRVQLKSGSRARYLYDVGLRLRISDNSTNGSWSLEGMALAFQPLPGLQRGMQGEVR